MTKNEFFQKLEARLNILNEQERNDILSEYRSHIEFKMQDGKTEEEAIAVVLTYSTRPGTSEHQTGLTVDMHDVDLNNMRGFNGTPSAEWLEHNAHRFGFILRYPEGKQEVTGIIYESWHFRYVGRTAATEMYEKGLTLDEYLA